MYYSIAQLKGDFPSEMIHFQGIFTLFVKAAMVRFSLCDDDEYL